MHFETHDSKKNLQYFLKKGVFDNNEVYYVIIPVKGYSTKIPVQDNIIVVEKDNVGYDFGAWATGLRHINTADFDYFIFINDTVRGPFLPRYVSNEQKWYVMFCNLINDKVKLSGLSINYLPWNKKGNKHVQSMIFCTDKIGLDILKPKIFNLSCAEYDAIVKKSKRDFIIKFEIGMSTTIIENGYDISALYVCDIQKVETGDIWYNNKYYKSTMNPFEVMFVKTNRVNSDIIDLYTNML